jgi:hypothetical protein
MGGAVQVADPWNKGRMPLHSSSRDTLTRFCRFPLTFNLPLLASVTNFHLCFGVGGGQGIERLESVSHVPGQSVTYVPGSSHAEEQFFKRERLKFRGLGRVHGDEKWWKHSSSHN